VYRSIKRVIFESIAKNNGNQFVSLQISEIKQIAGRAGRYKTAHQAVTEDKAKESAVDPVVGLDDTPVIEPENTTIGYATTLHQEDHSKMKLGMEREAEPIKTAGLFPPSLIVERFANYFPPGTPFSYITLRLHEISNIHPRFRLCALKDQLAIADAVHLIRNLSIQDRIMLCAAPSNMKDKEEKAFMQELATCIAENKSGDLLDLPNLPLEILDAEPSDDREYLKALERLHKMLVLYLWLSYRFPNVFTSRRLTTHVTKLVEEKIEHTLTQFSFTEQNRAGFDAKRRKTVKEFAEKDKDRSREPIIDVLDDTRAMEDEVAPLPSDEHEYLTLELGESERNNEEMDDGLQPKEGEENYEAVEVLKADTENTPAASDPSDDPSEKQALLHVDLPLEQLSSTQPRI
jgi:ATP-dependent RNA helicase SUPV3L1/SUV3